MDYIVKTSDLLKAAKELVEEGMDYVEISLFEPDEELPAMVSFCATEAGELDGWTDFDDLEVIDPFFHIHHSCDMMELSDDTRRVTGKEEYL